MSYTPFNLGGLRFYPELRGPHVYVTVRGCGAEGSRPLLGTLVLSSAEWRSFCQETQVLLNNS